MREGLLEALREGNEDHVDSCRLELKNWVRSIKGDVPKSCLAPLRELERHAVLVDQYFEKGNHQMMRSNCVSVGISLEKLKVCLLQVHPGLVGLGIDLKRISKSPERELLEECVKCYAIGAYRGAILNAVSALEATLRGLAKRQLLTRRPPPLYRVIEDLEKGGQLRGQDETIFHLCRVFRNL